jgi:FkbM family methyltransferase
MKSRTGQEVKLFVVSPDGTRTEMTNETEQPAGIKKNLLRVPAKNRMKALGLVAKMAIKKLFNKTYNERHEFMDLVYDIHHVEIEFEGKTLQLPFGGDLWFMLYHQIFVKNQYDLNEANTKGKIFVDAGANLGAFSIFAACMGARKVYAFEPVKGTFEALKTNIQACGFQDVIIPVNKGLGKDNFTANVKYDYSGDGGASIVTAGSPRQNERKNTQEIEVVTLDSFLKGEKVDLIKADVEGYEASVFVGASKTIATHAPILDFSAYHKPDDPIALPELINGIHSGYTCNLREHYEKVLYCDVKEASK